MKIGVFIDYENLKLDELLGELLSKLEQRNLNVYPRKLIFSNVAQLRKSFLDKFLKTYKLDLVGAYSSTGKNVADFRLYIEVLDLLYKSDATQGFCIVSADSDYAELVIKLRNENRYVIGIGPKEKCNIDYVNLFNEFIYTDELKVKPIEVVKPKEKVSKKKKPEKNSKIISQDNLVTVEVIKTPIPKKVIKNKSFYNQLKEEIESLLKTHASKKQKLIYISTLIKELKDKSPNYFAKVKMSSDDFKKIGYEIFTKEENRPETSYITLD